jgi:hypothetical protein
MTKALVLGDDVVPVRFEWAKQCAFLGQCFLWYCFSCLASVKNALCTGQGYPVLTGQVPGVCHKLRCWPRL